MSMRQWIKTEVQKKQKHYQIKQEQQFYRNMLRGKDYKGTETLFNEITLSWLIVMVTVFLQIISLATTYEGSKVYFGGVSLPFSLSAPLLFALAIQLTVFCMSHTIRRHFKKWLVGILIMATLCSAYFSYIGIYNHINSPLDYLEERYKQIYGNITEQYQLVVDESKNNMKEYVFDLVSQIDTSYTTLVKQVEENQKLSEQIDHVKVDNGKLNVQTNALKRPNINNYENNLDQYYSDMAKYNAAVGNMITETTKQDADLKNQLYENEVKALLGGKTKEQFTKESIATQTDKEQTEKLIQSMYRLIAPETDQIPLEQQLIAIQEYCINFIISGEGDQDIFSTVLTSLYTQVTTLGENLSLESFKKDLNHFVLISQKDAVIMKDLKQLKKQVYEEVNEVTLSDSDVILKEGDAMLLYTKMQSELKGAVYLLNQMNGLDEQIDLNNSKYILHNLYVLPIKNLLEVGDQRAMAWFCLAFAVLVDGLTLLFALMEGREKTALFAKNNKDIVGRSKEAIEELLLATLMSKDEQIGDSSRLETTLIHLETLLKQFELLPEGIESGYSMWCPLKSLENYKAFLAILCQFNLASILTEKEIVKGGYVLGETEEKYVLIKTKFVIWANQKIADLALRKEYINEVQEWDKRLLANEEESL